MYDYKGANVTPAARWIADGKVQLALYMRAAERLLGLRVVGGMYQPLGGGDLRARGVLDGGAGMQLECVRTDVLDTSELEGWCRMRSDSPAGRRRRRSKARSRHGRGHARTRAGARTRRSADAAADGR